MIMPGVQNPHCNAWLLRNASCIGCRVSPSATASIVSTERPSACSASKVQDLTASPSTWTTQAPHWLVSQPTCVPVRPSCSRNNCTKRVRPSTVAETGLPFTVRVTVFCIELSLHRSLAPSRDGGTGPEFYSGSALGQGVRSRSLTRHPPPGKVIEYSTDDGGQPGCPYDRRKPDVRGLCRLGFWWGSSGLSLNRRYRRRRRGVGCRSCRGQGHSRGLLGCDRRDKAFEELLRHLARD